MAEHLGYSYLYRARTPPPDWFHAYLKDYFEDFLPRYVARYLNTDIVVEEAPWAVPSPHGDSWVAYFERLRDQVTWGLDSMLVITDLHFNEVLPFEGIAGEDFYQVRPNWGWTSVRDWDQLAELPGLHPGIPYLTDRWYAMMLGVAPNYGINALGTAGHEMMHYVLLQQGGAQLSGQIDGGELSGMVLLDEGLNPVAIPRFDPPNFKWSAQRITTSLPCHVPMGAYKCKSFIPGFL